MRRIVRIALALSGLLVVGSATAAVASSFGRVGLDYLVSENDLVVAGEAVEAHSYWNEPGTLILTEVRLVVSEVLKGALDENEIFVTVPGGTVANRTNLVVGGADLEPGHSYVLFLRTADLPGAPGVRTVSDHCQGVFVIEPGEDGPRAVSQSVGRELASDAEGVSAPVGGSEGLPLDLIRRSVRELAAHDGRPEAK